jgi:hypothetical protein
VRISVSAYRESRGLVHRDTERRETPTGLKVVVL